MLQDQLGVVIHHARVVARSRAADPRVAALLALPEGAPLLVLHRWLYTEDESLLQYAVYHLPADLFELSLASRLTQPHAVSHAFQPAVPTLTLSTAHPR